MSRPDYVSIESWDSMSRKEKDYIRLLDMKKYTKDQIKRRLYITTDMGYWKLRKRVMKKLHKLSI